jgi:glycosyltransferase involved in cell wall biosynthesis
VLAARDAPPAESPKAVVDAVHRVMGHPMRVLLIDDRLPVPALGAGFPRMYDFALELAGTGRHHVAVLPTFTTEGDWTPFGRAGIEIVRQGVGEHLAEPGVGYDVVVISRPNNYEDCAEIIRSSLPDTPLVYDAEALFHRRMTKQLDFIADPLDRARFALATEQMRTLEARILADADLIVCLSEDEASIAREITGETRVITKIPFLGGITPSVASFERRSDIILVASWVAGPGSPNVDGLRWFIDDVFPVVQARIPWARLRITGGSPPASLTDAAGYGITFEGLVPDLRRLYEDARCVIVPLRFGSGVKIKTIEALQFGVPVVATTIGAEGIDLHTTQAITIRDDPRHFAEAVIQLVGDGDSWHAQRDHVRKLQTIWNQTEADRPYWTEIIEWAHVLPLAPSTTASPKSAHVG